MTAIAGLGPIQPPRPRAARPASRFAVAEQAPSAEPAAAALPVGLPGLLAMQEAETEAVRDRAARRHAAAMLQELAALQRALLGNGDAAALAGLHDRLAALAERMPGATDPNLAALLRAVGLRARVELARRGLRHSDHTGKSMRDSRLTP